ncbi:alpha-amylase [Streptomyces sp. NPDC058867]|uniref:alpha-amylase n=1 Tax=unclassified Streptomyces TaxID=2593676 RepID=UPI0036B027B7
MADLITRLSRPFALATVIASGILVAPTTAPPAVAATGSPALNCVEYFPSWRYTDVHNGCDISTAVTVEYANGQQVPCRVVEPDGWATFPGYGTNGNHVIGLLTCDPALGTASGA